MSVAKVDCAKPSVTVTTSAPTTRFAETDCATLAAAATTPVPTTSLASTTNVEVSRVAFFATSHS